MERNEESKRTAHYQCKVCGTFCGLWEKYCHGCGSELSANGNLIDPDAVKALISEEVSKQPDPAPVPEHRSETPAPKERRKKTTPLRWVALALLLLIAVIASLIFAGSGIFSGNKDEDIVEKEPEAEAEAEQETTIPNVMAADSFELWKEDEDPKDWHPAFYGTEILREEIRSVTFLSSLEEAEGKDSTDISALGDGSVLLWYSGDEGAYDVYIAAKGKIHAVDNTCKDLFSFCYDLEEINFNDSFDTSNATDMGGMFSGCLSLKSLDVSGFNTSKVTFMAEMFSTCASLTSLDVTSFDTSNVTNMAGMFLWCESLLSLDLSGFDTSRVTDMGSMFESCSSLEALDVSNFDTSNVTNMDSMFRDCGKLKSLDVSGFNTSNVTNMGRMFYECDSLLSLDVSGFNTSKVTDMEYMFYAVSATVTLPDPFDTSSCISYAGFMGGDGGEWEKYFKTDKKA